LATPRTGGEILVANLLAQDATHAFCVPGESYLAVLDALYDVRDRLALLVCRNEGGAAYMGEAYGKLTGRPGIVFVTRGPGASNAAVGIHTAAQDSSPMIVFVGQVGGDYADREAFQEIDYRRMYGSVAKWAAQIDRAERIPEYVARAYRVAMSGRQVVVRSRKLAQRLTDYRKLALHCRTKHQIARIEGLRPNEPDRSPNRARPNQTHPAG